MLPDKGRLKVIVINANITSRFFIHSKHQKKTNCLFHKTTFFVGIRESLQIHGFSVLLIQLFVFYFASYACRLGGFLRLTWKSTMKKGRTVRRTHLNLHRFLLQIHLVQLFRWIQERKVLSIQSNLGMLRNYADVFSYVDMLDVAELYFNFVVDSDI